MTPFLSRLLARTHGTADVLRPRVPSIFEGGLTELADVEHPVVMSTQAEPAGQPRTMLERVQLPRSSAPLSVRTTEPRHRRVAASLETTTRTLTHEERTSSSLLRSERVDVEHTRLRATASPDVHDAIATPARLATSEPAAARPRHADATRAEPVVEQKTVPALGVRGARRAANTSPSVHVSIGRVEVRTASDRRTAPARHEPKTPRPAPALRLDEYLRQRKDG